MLNSFSGISIHHGVGDSETIHNGIQNLADEMSQTKRKWFVSLLVEFGEPRTGIFMEFTGNLIN